MSSTHFQPNLPVMPVNRLDRPSPEGEAGVQNMEGVLPLAKARELTGGAVQQAIRGRALKEFGDPAAVLRWCKGIDNPNLARLFADPQSRREFVVALAESCPASDGIHVQTAIVVPGRRRA